MQQTIHPSTQHPAVIAMRARLESAEARIAELEAREQRIREAAFHPMFNSLESVATIKTILTLG